MRSRLLGERDSLTATLLPRPAAGGCSHAPNVLLLTKRGGCRLGAKRRCPGLGAKRRGRGLCPKAAKARRRGACRAKRGLLLLLLLRGCSAKGEGASAGTKGWSAGRAAKLETS